MFVAAHGHCSDTSKSHHSDSFPKGNEKSVVMKIADVGQSSRVIFWRGAPVLFVRPECIRIGSNRCKIHTSTGKLVPCTSTQKGCSCERSMCLTSRDTCNCSRLFLFRECRYAIDLTVCFAYRFKIVPQGGCRFQIWVSVCLLQRSKAVLSRFGFYI